MFCKVNFAGFHDENQLTHMLGCHILAVSEDYMAEEAKLPKFKKQLPQLSYIKGKKDTFDWLLLLAIKGEQFFTAYSLCALTAPRWMLLMEGWKEMLKKGNV